MTTKKYPTPLYAVAGAGDYAYQQLRKLPARLTELPARVSQLRDRVTPSDLGVRADLDHLREVARRNAQSMLGEARTVYADLVERGERVVDGAAVAVLEPAEATASEAAPVAASVADAVPAKAAKPARRARPATRK